ncbi:MAG: CoA-binding protein [Anaerolineae bacterium]|nr:CoA-binding protein [Anaerolineae bacterium]MDK1081555.1 CoA-binding protein [Anaerolineae bacterium]MDK1117760.1 CoA-binding protein [Anaerolineae bacterium]
MNEEQFLREILESTKTIATVGLSTNPAKVSNEIGAYLQNAGYRVIPVNPKADEILGEKSYPDLLSIPVPIDVVQIFRKPEDVPPVVEAAIKVGAKVVWMQEGIVNEEAAEVGREAGLKVVMDACMRAMHRYFFEG